MKESASVFNEGTHEKKTVLVFEERGVGVEEKKERGREKRGRDRQNLRSVYSNTQPLSSCVPCIFL